MQTYEINAFWFNWLVLLAGFGLMVLFIALWYFILEMLAAIKEWWQSR